MRRDADVFGAFICIGLVAAQATVLGMLELKELATFKNHLRDFLVQSNQFADQNNADLYAEEVAASVSWAAAAPLPRGCLPLACPPSASRGRRWCAPSSAAPAPAGAALRPCVPFAACSVRQSARSWRKSRACCTQTSSKRRWQERATDCGAGLPAAWQLSLGSVLAL